MLGSAKLSEESFESKLLRFETLSSSAQFVHNFEGNRFVHKQCKVKYM